MDRKQASKSDFQCLSRKKTYLRVADGLESIRSKISEKLLRLIVGDSKLNEHTKFYLKKYWKL